MHELLRNFIDGEWVEAEGGRTLENRNPADAREVLGHVARSTKGDTKRAIDAAKRSFDAWRKVPAPKRGAMVLEAMRLMIERKEQLAKALTLEEGKTFVESLGEVQKSINVLEFMSGEGRRLNGTTIPSELPKTFAYTARAPLGVVGVVTPWNFPVCIPTWKIAPALIAGNTVVFKPATITPWTAKLVTEIFADAGIPKGVLNLVFGSGGEVGQTIIESTDIRALSFTGSNEIGAKLYETGARTLKKVQCEMGGKNPVIVLEDADLDLAATAIVQGAFGSTGQRCTATSRVVVSETVADQLVEKIAVLTKKIRVGNGMAPGVDMGPTVDEGQLNTVLAFHQIGREEGAKLICGGSRLTEGDLAHGYFTAPTVYDHVRPESRLAQEEVFGPVLSVIRVKNWPEALKVANGVKFGLSSSIFTRDVTRAMEYAEDVDTGMLHVNSATVGGESQMPFGGTKATGVGGREMGQTAIDFFSEWKTVYIDYTGSKRESKIY
jgi:aldehyde dehydrogenase (NAD+)